jgi:hypothetical protein
MARQNGRGHGVYNSLSQAYMLIHFIFSKLHASAVPEKSRRRREGITLASSRTLKKPAVFATFSRPAS